MNPAALFVLTGTKGGQTHLCVLEALNDHAQNTHHLAETINVSHPTLDHHLDILQTNGFIEKQGAHSNDAYQITRQMQADWADVEDLLEHEEKANPLLLGIFKG